MSGKKRVMSGMRPTGRLHLGNYWGSLVNYVKLQEQYDCYFEIADWHMLTTGYEDTAKLEENAREMLLDWLAAGVDPSKCVVFRQSDVHEHAELWLLLSMITPLSWLENNPTWKEQLQELSKVVCNVNPYVQRLGATFVYRDFQSGLGETSVRKDEWLRTGQRQPSQRPEGEITCAVHPDRVRDLEPAHGWPAEIRSQANFVGTTPGEIRISAGVSVLLDSAMPKDEAHWRLHWTLEGHKSVNTQGFLGYAVLQAADILLYRGELVPVGKDQLPHLEITREIARRFNSIYAKGAPPVLSEPEALLTETPKVPGLDGRKMSKSYGNAVDLLETSESLQRKIMSAYTDALKIKKDDPGHPEPSEKNPPGCTVYALHKLYSDYWPKRKIECESGQIGCVACKKDLLKSMEGPFQEFREKRERLANEKGRVEEILAQGARKAKAEAEKTMDKVRRAMHLK